MISSTWREKNSRSWCCHHHVPLWVWCSIGNIEVLVLENVIKHSTIVFSNHDIFSHKALEDIGSLLLTDISIWWDCFASKLNLFLAHVKLQFGCPSSPIQFITYMDRISRGSQQRMSGLWISGFCLCWCCGCAGTYRMHRRCLQQRVRQLGRDQLLKSGDVGPLCADSHLLSWSLGHDQKN